MRPGPRSPTRGERERRSSASTAGWPPLRLRGRLASESGAESIVHSLRGLEGLGYVGRQDNDIRPFGEPLGILAAHRSREVVLWSHLQRPVRLGIALLITRVEL